MHTFFCFSGAERNDFALSDPHVLGGLARKGEYVLWKTVEMVSPWLLC